MKNLVLFMRHLPRSDSPKKLLLLTSKSIKRLPNQITRVSLRLMATKFAGQFHPNYRCYYFEEINKFMLDNKKNKSSKRTDYTILINIFIDT